MYCQKCGTKNDDNAYKCIACENILHEGAAVPAPQQIPNYLVQSILITLFCCLPLGIPAIVFASQVDSKVQAGDIQGALESSRKAKLWCSWSIGVAIVGGILYFMFMILAVLAESSGY